MAGDHPEDAKGTLVPAVAPAEPRPCRRPIDGLFDLLVRGWRPMAGWACVIVITVRGAVMPLWEIAADREVSPMDWVSLTALIGMLGLARYRHLEKSAGTTL